MGERTSYAPSHVTALGGSVILPRTDVPAGRFAVPADPQGAVFCAFEGELDE
jgi:predicted enzyme related to lactoylglutathione lyase